MPDDDLENSDDLIDSSSSRPNDRQRKKSLDFTNDFIRGWFHLTGTCETGV
jgi:hypothetical protein